MKLAVFGANGPTGQILVRQALAQGHEITAFTRHPDAFPPFDGALRVAAGDVADVDAVTAAVDGADAVLSTLGVPFSKHPISVYSVGATNLVEAMHRTGGKRIVCVSSSTMAPHPEPQGGVVFRKVLQPYVVGTLGRTLYDDMRRMEAIVQASDLDWTIVRPSGLFTAGAVTPYRTAEEAIVGRFTAREDLADCLLRRAADGDHVGRALAIATVDRHPSIVQVIWTEGIRKR